MPNIQFMNPPPNPFWGFVADMQNHPFFAAYEGPQRPGQPRQGEPAATAGPSNTNAASGEQTNVEDPPEVDPATIRAQNQEAYEGRWRERRGCRRRSNSSDEEGEREHRRERGGRRGGWGRHGPHGFGEHGHPHAPPPGPFGPGFPFGRFQGGPFWARGDQHRGPPGPPGPPGSHEHEHEHHGPPGFGPGPRGRGFPFRRGGLHPHSHPHGHGPHGHGRRGPSPPPGPRGFDLGRFLNELGERIGMDLTDAAQNLGLDRFMPNQTNAEVDFEPKVDIFDLPTNYTVHVSLPGAKKSDVGVDWDGEHSVLRVAGVVHRPDVDEEMLARLVVDGRKRETGVFEKTIKLGTRREPAVVDVANITAKMRDGVLVVTVPKTEKGTDKREVPIAKSESVSPVRRETEKDLLLDTDHIMNDDKDEAEGEIQMIDRDEFEQSNAHKGKRAEYEAEKEKTQEQERERTTREEMSATVEAEEPEREAEPLPAYHATEHREREDHSDWENFESDEEGEFVKINVD